MKIEKLICLCVSVLLLCAVPASATVYYWIGDVDSNYTTWGNWNTSAAGSGTTLAGTPSSTADDLFINTGSPYAVPVLASTDTVTIRDSRVGVNGVGQLDVYGKLVTTRAAGGLDFQVTTSTGSTGTVNVFSGGAIESQSFDLAYFGTGTMTIEAGASVLANDRFRMGHGSSLSAGALYLDGTLEVKDVQGTRGNNQFTIRNTGNHTIYIGANGLITLDGDRTAHMDGYIDNGWIVATNAGWTVESSFADSKTTVFAVIPEPATLGLLAFGSLSLLKRRK